MRAARSPDRTQTTAGAIFSSAPRSHLLVVRTRPQTERATDSAIRTQGACSLRRTAVNRTPLWMRYQPALGGECAEPYRMGSRAPAALGEVHGRPGTSHSTKRPNSLMGRQHVPSIRRGGPLASVRSRRTPEVEWFRSESGRSPSSVNREQPPRPGYTLEIVLTAVGELDLGACHQVDDSARDQDLPRAGEGTHPRADVYGDPADLLAL